MALGNFCSIGAATGNSEQGEPVNLQMRQHGLYVTDVVCHGERIIEFSLAKSVALHSNEPELQIPAHGFEKIQQANHPNGGAQPAGENHR